MKREKPRKTVVSDAHTGFHCQKREHNCILLAHENQRERDLLETETEIDPV